VGATEPPRAARTWAHSSGVPDPALRERDWFRSAVFYEIPVRSFYDSNGDGIGDLPGVTEKLDYLSELGVRAIWLLPFYRSAWRDEGYDITDHYSVDPSLGTLDDLDRLITASHDRGIRVLGDLVTNHVSIDHPWFQKARADRDSPYRNWFLWSNTGKEYSRTRVIFKDVETTNWTWDITAGQFYFHRFYATQPDLNYDEPAVHEEMFKVVRFWLGRGLDGFRCDAVPYLYKREGTRCQSLPETHAFFRSVRTILDAEFPGAVLVAEANQSIPETIPYFGDGHEFPMVMHFPLMPNLYLAYAEEDPRRLRHLLRATLPTPRDCGWAYFLRNHDEVTLEQVSDDEREMFLWYFGRDPRTVVNGGVRRRLAPMLDGNDASILLMIALILSLPGAPFLYYGDEIGMGDRIDLPDRDGVRTPMQWTSAPNAGFSRLPVERLIRPPVGDPNYGPPTRNVADERARPDSLLRRVQQLIAIRAAHVEEFESVGLRLADAKAPGVLAFWRDLPAAPVLCLFNLSRAQVSGTLGLEPELKSAPVRLVGEVELERTEAHLRFALEGRRFAWVRFSRPVPVHGARSRHPEDRLLHPPE